MKILFFTPHMALWVHTVPEAYIARALNAAGHEVEYLTCAKAQNYCACMTARRLPPGCSAEEADPVCARCEQGAKSIERVYRFPMKALADYLTEDDKAMCASLAKEAVVQKSLDTEFLGVKVGRVSLYEFTLYHKKMSVDLTPEQWTEYGIYLENSLITLRAFSRHLEFSKPDVVTTFSPQYSNLNSCMQYAINQGVRTLFMESGTNLSHRLGTMRVWDWKVHKLVNPALTYWGSSEANPVTETSAKAVSGHFSQLLSGQHFAVFSSPYAGSSSVRERWHVRSEQKLAVMTLSSYDEAYAALLIDGFPMEKVFSSVFRTQADWVRETIEWAKSRPDIFFVVRVHPRDFPNKRETFRSEQSFALEELLRDVPENVHVNWPSEGVSLYELLEDTDAVITGWSVTAMEALILGIPVVTYDRRLPSYPRDIMWTGTSKDEYWKNINDALSTGWSFENVRNGFRWLAYNFVECTLVVSRRFGGHEQADWSPVSQFVKRVKDKLPTIGQPIELLGWGGAKEDIEILDTMLEKGFDAIPPAKSAIRARDPKRDDTTVINAQLKVLYALLYEDSKLPPEKPGLARSIREHLSRAEQS